MRRATPLIAAATIVAATGGAPKPAGADEGGVSFWLHGLYGSLAAAPQTPGLTFGSFFYHTSVSAGAGVSRSREFQIGRLNPALNVNLSANLHADANFVFLNPGYVFETPVLGAQAAVGLGMPVGRSSASLSGTLTAAIPPFSITRTDSINNSVTSNGDLLPSASLKWNQGVNNFMVYGTGDIPAGAYSATRLANLGIGHGAVDGGAGYTFLNLENGREFSAVAGLTYNLKNDSTNYQNGADFHLDWAASQLLSKQLFVGLTGYLYHQVTDDSGGGDHVGGFKSQVAAVGPQIGYIFPVGSMQGYLNLKGYGEFAARNRPSGYNIWLTFAISPAAPAKN